jgi:CrcB protein
LPGAVAVPNVALIGLIALFGALGALTRWGLSAWVGRVTDGAALPWGTVAVNVIGCLIFGLIAELSAQREMISTQTRAIVLVGFFGAFTTFSTFAYESSELLRAGRTMAALLNISIQNVAGLAAIILGVGAARLVSSAS